MAATAAGLNHLISFPKKVQVHFGQDIRLVIENNKSGIFYPQNSEYVSTVDIIKIAAKYFNHKIIFIRLFNPLIKLLSKRLGVINKIFGTKFYDMSLSPDLEKYNIVDFETSIKECVLAFK
ncbi:MAG: hypothetical protein IIX56_02345 [Treponema sp.]|nr:hypothetical protein [Treponema sp.]